MENSINIAIIENDVILRNNLVNACRKYSFVGVVTVLSSGEHYLNALSECVPDVLIIDELLPHKTGSDILLELKETSIKPYVIYTLNVNNTVLTKKAIQGGADEIVLKPYDVNDMARKVKCVYETFIANISSIDTEVIGSVMVEEEYVGYLNNSALARKAIREHNLKESASQILCKAGFSRRHNGYAYLILAAKIAHKYDGKPYKLVKDIYPIISDKYNVSNSMIESSIRNSIAKAWKKCSECNLKNNILTTFDHRPTNYEFLQLLAETIVDDDSMPV